MILYGFIEVINSIVYQRTTNIGSLSTIPFSRKQTIGITALKIREKDILRYTYRTN